MSELSLTNGSFLSTSDGIVKLDVLVGDGYGPLHNGVHVVAPERSVSVKDCLIVPGLVDSHFHLMTFALARVRVDLGRASSCEDALALLAEHASSSDNNSAVVGIGFDETSWERQELPTREQLDKISKDVPVYARRICGHVGVANSALLERLEVTTVQFDDATGLTNAGDVDPSSGRLRETSVFAANRLTFPDDDTVARAIADAIAALHRIGITGIHDIIDPAHIRPYLAGLELAEHPLVIDGYFCAAPERFDELQEQSTSSPPWFRPVGIKLFADGSIGARTAALRKPYADADTRGELTLSKQEITRTLEQCARREIGCAIHAIGDRALDAILDAMDDASDLPFVRIEHAELGADSHIDRLLERGVLLGMQPNFAGNWGADGGLYHTRLGNARARKMNPFRSLVDAGVAVCFGSDVMPAGPLYGIRCAVEHPVASERLPVETALDLYSRAAWRHGSHGQNNHVVPRTAKPLEETSPIGLPDHSRDHRGAELSGAMLTIIKHTPGDPTRMEKVVATMCGARWMWQDRDYFDSN